MLEEKPCQPVVSLRENQQMKLDSEVATHTGMECQSRSSHRYLLLQVWCALLTVAMVVMAVLLTSIKPKSTESEALTPKPDVSSTGRVNPFAANTMPAPRKSGSPISYIELVTSSDNQSWQDSESCDSCFLTWYGNSIHCKKDSLFFIYAQVAFSRHSKNNHTKEVVLIRNATRGKRAKKVLEGTYPHTTEGTVWVSRIIKLKGGDSIRINITGDFLKDITFWGAFELH